MPQIDLHKLYLPTKFKGNYQIPLLGEKHHLPTYKLTNSSQSSSFSLFPLSFIYNKNSFECHWDGTISITEM